jgi:hypothetical protein
MNVLEIITIGFPFCAFKIITGLYFGQTWLVGLGIIDLVINFINLISVLFSKKRALDTCLLTFLVHQLKKPSTHVKNQWQDLGNSVDVLLSFILVAWVIASGAIGNLPAQHLLVWNIAVILNVLGAGSSRLTCSVKNLL